MPAPQARRRGLRWIAGSGALALLGVWLMPALAGAVTPPLSCVTAGPTLPWQHLPVPAFPGVQNVSTTDRITTYGVDDAEPHRVLVTNGTTVQASVTNGCTWSRPLTLQATSPSVGYPSGASSRIVHTLLLPSGRGVLELQEGTGAASRPRILSSQDATSSGYQPTESGLPQQGAPGAIAAARDGKTVYLSVQPSGRSAGSTAGPLPLPVPIPSVPVAPGGPGSTAGLIYASGDGGATWALRTTPADATAGGSRNFSALAVDPAGIDRLYAIASGALLRSTDGGASFSDITPAHLGTATSLSVGGGGELVVFGSGGGFLSPNGGASFLQLTSQTASGVAFRGLGEGLAIEFNGYAAVYDFSKRTADPSRVSLAPGSLTGDDGAQSTFHGISGHDLVRYADRTVSGGGIGPATKVVGDLPPAPPRSGIVAPNGLTVTLPPGGTKAVTYNLALPDDPTPLNVFYLVDISSTLTEYQADLKANIGKISAALAGRRISLRVGIGTVGTGPSDGKPPYPDTSATQDGTPYRKPTLYHLLRRLGPADAGFFHAVSQVQTETLPYPFIYGDKNGDAEEGQLLSLEQLATGSGVLSPQSSSALPQYVVPGGQEAGFEPNPFVRNVVVFATDEYFANPTGSPRTPDSQLDYDKVTAELRALHIQQLGLTIGTGAGETTGSFHDLAHIARDTGAIAPQGGIRCSDTEQVPAGSPIVCTQPDNFSSLLVSVLSGLRDVQTLTVSRSGQAKAVTAVSAPSFGSVDVTKAHVLPFTVTYSCAGLAAGRYPTSVGASLRGYAVGTATATVECLAAPAIAPVLPLILPPPVRPLLRAVPPPPPPPPPAPPQVPPQGQAQTQINPVSAAALQEEQQLQLALALQAPEPPEPDTELAMVSRSRGEEHNALALLVTAMAAASIGGVVRLRVKPHPALQRVRRA